MVVREMSGHTAEETIAKLSSIFAELGLPKTIHCDRGTNYTSTKFQEFCNGLNIKVTYSSAEHHSSNYAERGVQTVKQFMRKTGGMANGSVRVPNDTHKASRIT